MPNPQSPASGGAESSKSTPTRSGDPSPTFHPFPSPATNSAQTAVTFATPSSGIPHPRPKKSVKRRPPTPGGPSSADAFQKVARSQLLQPHPELPSYSTPPSSRTPLAPSPIARTAPTSSTARKGEGILPSSHPESPSQPRPHRRKPSRLNLSAISNHGSLPPSPSNAQLHSPTSPHGPVPASITSIAQDPSQARQDASAPSHPGHQGTSSIRLQERGLTRTLASGRHLKRRGTIDSEDSPDGHSMTSANLDSPSTKAMMERLLSAPDYFTLHDPRDVDDDDDTSTGSLKFAKVGEDRENEDGHEDRRLRNVREQRERSKIQKLLGSDVDNNAGSVSRPRRVDGFWSDSDFKQGVSAGNKGSAEIGGPASPSWKRKRSVPSSFKAPAPNSPKGPGFWSSSVPSLGSPRADERYGDSQERLLLPRASQDSRYRSTSKEQNLRSPPSSPRERHLSSDSNRHPRVHALDALRPAPAIVKRSKTMSGAIVTSHSNPEAIIPPPRLSSRNALNAQKATADGHVGKEAGIDARTRVKPSKSAKTLSISQSEPHHHQTPAGVVVEEYKRQIHDTQKATPASKESRRLSALQWMIEQTKSVTRSRSASASVPPSPHSSNQSMSPPFSVTNFARSQAIARSKSGIPATTMEQHLSPGGPSMPPLPSPMSIVSANNSSSSLLSPEARFGRPAPVYSSSRPRARGEVLSPVLASASVQPPDSPWDGSSSLLVPGSPRSEGHQSSETGHYVPARSHPGYWSSGETRGGEKEKRGMVSGLGKKLSKRKLNKRKEECGEKEVQDSQSRGRVWGRSEARDGGAQSDTQAQRLPRRGVSVDRPPTLHHRKSLRLSIDKFADDGNVSQSPSSFHGVSSPTYQKYIISWPSVSSSGYPYQVVEEGERRQQTVLEVRQAHWE
ncbi:hypothetical protein FA13DRAFT_1130411 [Coprinellus micaceus]|uniref:Uncharacterized protein n=1 Tax=Coprinellus micaceus TaxID=71717 RepID=A0A4Y7SVY6_COPMI|nr:hypothetical protein FA13DRAFT_1130411 [Coprinellus micaceus]